MALHVSAYGPDAHMMISDISEIVRGQLPRVLADRLEHVELHSDAFHLRTVVRMRFKEGNGRWYETPLEYEQIGSRRIACRIPELFIARMCAEL